MSSKVKSTRGISLVSLIITIVVLMILSNVIIYNVEDNLKLRKLTEMQSDIEDLRDKVSIYDRQNGKIPASIKYTNINLIKEAGVISDAVDTGDFLVIDLSALENLTLNKGKDFEKVKNTPENVNNYTDLYIINEASHNIFYVAGVTIDNETFYTDYTADKVDTAPVTLKYVENVQIPDGFYYVEGTKDTGITIKSNDNTQEYRWVQQDKKITKIPNDLEIDTNQQEDFIKSVNAHQGYYKNVNDDKVMCLGLENWSPFYDKEGIYKDKNGDTAYIPKEFSVSETPGENTIDEGLVVKDKNQNEWVWIEVPKSIYKTATSNEDYEKIEKDMQTYVSNYRDNHYADTWYSEEQHGFANANQYNDWKNNMLKSVYDKGGFYIGRYEVGTTSARDSSSTTEMTPMIQKNAYPYNYVTCKQAKILSENLVADKTTSLMFGIQWDLVLKYIETKGDKTQNLLKIDSSTWGNYRNSEFMLTRNKVQYAMSPLTATSWRTVSSSYTKLDSSSILLTTGATNRNQALNIYDLAGNVWEWTLETTQDVTQPNVVRSGSGYHDATTYPVSCRLNDMSSDKSESLGFRVVLYE